MATSRRIRVSPETASSSASSAYRFAGAAMLRNGLNGTESTLQARRCATAWLAETRKYNRDRGAARSDTRGLEGATV